MQVLLGIFFNLSLGFEWWVWVLGFFNFDLGDEDVHTEVYLIRHAESTMNAHPELVGGRSPLATLTALGKRQAHALGVHLRSLGVDFDAVYSSPLERAKQTAFFVCQVQY